MLAAMKLATSSRQWEQPWCNPETRFCVAIVGGAANVFVTMQLHRVSDLDPVLRRLQAGHPGVVVLDKRVVLRSVKSWGRLRGADDRAGGVVPVGPWAPFG